jgi:hypothetical protein
VRFQVLKAASIKTAIFWNDMNRSLIETDRRFRGSYRATTPFITKAVNTSETSVNFYEITWHIIPDYGQSQFVCWTLVMVYYKTVFKYSLHSSDLTYFNIQPF